MEHIFAAAAEVPTGIPTGIPPAVTDAASKIATEGGLLGSLLILALTLNLVLGWVIWLRQRMHEAALEKQQEEHEKDRGDWDARLRAVLDQRIAEIREVMTALNSNTGALNVISQTQVDRTASMERLTGKLGDVVNHVASLERLGAEHTKAIDRNLGVIDRIAWAVSAKGSSAAGSP